MSGFFRVSGKKVAVPATTQGWKFAARPGGWIVAQREDGSGGFERRRFTMQEARGRLSASLSGVLWNGELVESARGGAGGSSGGGDADLTAQFPGKVRKLLVKAGQRVAEGEPLLMVEAMKMEFAVKAPANGVIKTVLVKEGQQLSPGDRFVDFVEEAAGDK